MCVSAPPPPPPPSPYDTPLHNYAVISITGGGGIKDSGGGGFTRVNILLSFGIIATRASAIPIF